MPHNATVARDLKERFPRVWCPTCNKTQPMIFDVMKANDKNEHDAADMSAANASRSSPSVRRTGVRPNRAAKAQEMAAQEIDRLIDPSAPDEERQRRKRRLLKGPKEFRDARSKR